MKNRIQIYLNNMIMFFVMLLKPKTTVSVEHFMEMFSLTEKTKTTSENWSATSRKKSKKNANLNKVIEEVTSDFNHLEESSSYDESWEGDSSYDSDFDDSYEGDYEQALQEEGLENVEDLNRMQKRRVARRMRKRNGGRYVARRANLKGSMANIQGQVTLKITRESYNIPFDLPCEVFNPLDGFCNSPITTRFINNSDIQLISGYVANNFTDFVFRYRQISTNQFDNITISCNEVAYVKLMFGLMVDKFVVSGGTVKISDETQTIQFDKRFSFANQNILGKEDSNPLNMGSFIKPNNFRKDIADILIKFPVNKQRGFIFTSAYISGQVVGYKLTTTFFLNLNQIRLWV